MPLRAADQKELKMIQLFFINQKCYILLAKPSMMKKILCLFLVFLACLTVRAQIQSSCQSGTALQTLYSKDIAHIALVYLYETQSPDTALIGISQPYLDSVGRAMAAVFNLNDQLEADSVMRRHCIHQDRYPGAEHLSGARNGVSLQVQVDPAQAWTAGWSALNAVTGYATLDALMALYGFQVISYSNGSGSDKTAVIRTAQVINAKAFADSLRKLDGILDVRFVNSVGDGNYIRYTYNNGAAYLMFRMGWGDCPLGCTAEKRWYYKIDDQCRVTLDSVRLYLAPGAYPIPTNCGITAIKDPVPVSLFVIYPNPATNAVTIALNGSETYSYTLADSYGRQVAYGIAKGTVTLFLSGFAKGFYGLQVADKRETGKSKSLCSNK